MSITQRDDPQSSANHLVLGLDLEQRKEARGLAGGKSGHNWADGR